MTLIAAFLATVTVGAQEAKPPRDVIAFVTDRDDNREIYLMTAEGEKAVNVTRNPAEDWYPDWSPDSTRLSFTSSRDGGWDLYVMNVSDAGVTRLTRDQGWNGRADWSPDGKSLAFHTYRDGNWEIYMMAPDGSGQRNLTRTGSSERMPSWSPDGKRIAFETDRDGDSEIYVMGADGKAPKNLTRHGAEDGCPTWSPDGKFVAYHTDRDGKAQIYVIGAAGGKARRVSDGRANDLHPVWSPGGKRIAFQSDRMGSWDVFVVNADGSGLKNLTKSESNDDWCPVSFGRIGAAPPTPSALDPKATGKRIESLVSGWSGEKKPATLGLMREVVLEATTTGAEIYKKGDEAGCALLYVRTGQLLTGTFAEEGAATPAATRALRDLRGALGRARGEPDETSWAMRYAFDRIVLDWNLRSARVKTLVGLGNQYFSIGRYEEAELSFEEAAGLLPELFGRERDKVEMNCRLAPLALGHARFARGKFPESARAIIRGLEGVPTWPDTPLDVRSLHTKKDDYDRRRKELEEAVEKNGGDADLQFLLGYELHFTGKKKDAEARFRKALELDRDHPGARRFLPEAKKKKREF